MKLIVTQKYNNEVEIHLHPDTKKTIKKIAFWTVYATGCTAYVVYMRTRNTDSE